MDWKYLRNIGTDRLQQTVQTQIKLLLKEQFNQDLHGLPSYGRTTALKYQIIPYLDNYNASFWGVPFFRIFMVHVPNHRRRQFFRLCVLYIVCLTLHLVMARWPVF